MSGPDCETCGEYFLDCTCMTRPQIPIDWEQVDYMLEYGANGTTIAAKFAMHPNTFYDRVAEKYKMSFTEYSQLKRSVGDDNIREAQYRKALKKLDNTMLVWLGKQRLGQKENAGEKVVPEEVLRAFNELMVQLDKAQSERNMETSTMSTEAKSACVTNEPLASAGRESIF